MFFIIQYLLDLRWTSTTVTITLTKDNSKDNKTSVNKYALKCIQSLTIITLVAINSTIKILNVKCQKQLYILTNEYKLIPSNTKVIIISTSYIVHTSTIHTVIWDTLVYSWGSDRGQGHHLLGCLHLWNRLFGCRLDICFGPLNVKVRYNRMPLIYR